MWFIQMLLSSGVHNLAKLPFERKTPDGTTEYWQTVKERVNDISMPKAFSGQQESKSYFFNLC